MTVKGSCHCGRIRFEIDGEIPERLVRCTCSFCSKRGGLYAYYQPRQFRLDASLDSDQVYRWNTKLVEHHFCGHCGVPTFSDSPAFERDGSWDGKSRRIAPNARLFDGFDAASAPVSVVDGKNLW